MKFFDTAKAAYDIDFLKDKATAQQAGKADSIGAIASKVIDTMLLVGGILAVIYFIYSGILYLTAAGNPDAAKKGQQGLLYGAIGIAVIVVSYYAVRAATNASSFLLGNT